MKNESRIRFIGAMFLVGVPFNIICYLNHVCMAGHLHHMPYPVWTYVTDFVWGILFIACGVLGIRTKAKRSVIFSAGCFLFVFLRFFAMGEELLLPLAIYMIWLAVRYIAVTEKYDLTLETPVKKGVGGTIMEGTVENDS